MERRSQWTIATLGAAALAVAALGATGDARADESPTNPAAAAVKDHIMVSPEQLKWEACSPALPPSARCASVEGDRTAPNVLFTFRAKLPDGYRVAPHFHPADEHLTVIQGTFAMGLGKTFDAAALHPMGAGSFMVMPKGSAHFAEARGETVIQVHAIGPWGITYVNPADDPRNAKTNP
jgi:quercetin dioxygenase-like cupin family protein